MNQEMIKTQHASLSTFIKVLSAIQDCFEKNRLGCLEELAVEAESIKNDCLSLKKNIREIELGKRPLVVAFVGSYNAGKSSVINTLLEQDLCPVLPVPTTSFITKFLYGKESKIELREGKTITPISANKYFNLVQEREVSRAKKDQKRYSFTYHCPNEQIKGFEILDTPGFFNSENATDDKVTTDAIKSADVLVWVFDISRGDITSDEKKKLLEITNTKPGLTIYDLINKSDLKSSESRHKMLSTHRENKIYFKSILYCAKPFQQDNFPDICGPKQLRDIFAEIGRNKARILMQKNQLKYSDIHSEFKTIIMKATRNINCEIRRQKEIKRDTKRVLCKIHRRFKDTDLEDEMLDVFNNVVEKYVKKYNIDWADHPYVPYFGEPSVGIYLKSKSEYKVDLDGLMYKIGSRLDLLNDNDQAKMLDEIKKIKAKIAGKLRKRLTKQPWDDCEFDNKAMADRYLEKFVYDKFYNSASFDQISDMLTNLIDKIEKQATRPLASQEKDSKRIISQLESLLSTFPASVTTEKRKIS